jgi:GrpB-like predicted nucleotidyltransferase (UPF0157 family)
VNLVEYDPDWPASFEKLSGRVLRLLADLVSRIEHIGSTAVPGLLAKPIIDLDVVVRSNTDIPPAIQRLATIGYRHEGNLAVEGREAFRWPPGEAPHHLYLVAAGARELQRHIAFRDALRADDALRDRYAELKRTLARLHPDDRLAYTMGKQEFIARVLERQMPHSPGP